ncbi:MAG: Os1348 family NHLP clan protein [Acidobacteriota bacterium]
MSHKAVEDIISRAVVDTEFREQLFSAPDKALAGNDLTPEERKALAEMSREKFDSSLGQLEELAVSGGIIAVHEGVSSPIPAPVPRFDWTKIGYAPSNTN